MLADASGFKTHRILAGVMSLSSSAPSACKMDGIPALVLPALRRVLLIKV